MTETTDKQQHKYLCACDGYGGGEEENSSASDIIIFPIYYKEAPIFQNEIIKPIQAGSSLTNKISDIFHDDTGDNISHKNANYGELTATYWVWKNYLKKNKNLKYVGFCHYRRFFNFLEKNKKRPFLLTDINKFAEKFNKNNQKNDILRIIQNYDIVLPSISRTKMSTYSQFINSHPKDFINKAQEIIKQDYPEYEPFMNDFLSGNKLYLCLNFVMKTELFDEWCKWIFDILFKLEKEIDLTVYNEYHTVRGPAFLAERFFNVWLLYQIKTKNIKILNRQSYILETLNSKTFNFLIGKYVIDKKRRIINILGLKLTIKK